MRPEVGKKYRTQDGAIAHVLLEMPAEAKTAYPLIGYIEGSSGSYNWTLSGTSSYNNNLVEEIKVEEIKPTRKYQAYVCITKHQGRHSIVAPGEVHLLMHERLGFSNPNCWKRIPALDQDIED
jgi:hypothetical protein